MLKTSTGQELAYSGLSGATLKVPEADIERIDALCRQEDLRPLPLLAYNNIRSLLVQSMLLVYKDFDEIAWIDGRYRDMQYLK